MQIETTHKKITSYPLRCLEFFNSRLKTNKQTEYKGCQEHSETGTLVYSYGNVK